MIYDYLDAIIKKDISDKTSLGEQLRSRMRIARNLSFIGDVG